MTLLGHTLTMSPHAKGFLHSIGGSLFAFLAIKVHQDTIQFLIVLASLLNGLAAVGYPVLQFVKFVMRWLDRRPRKQAKIVYVPDSVKWGPNG